MERFGFDARREAPQRQDVDEVAGADLASEPGLSLAGPVHLTRGLDLQAANIGHYVGERHALGVWAQAELPRTVVFIAKEDLREIHIGGEQTVDYGCAQRVAGALRRG